MRRPVGERVAVADHEPRPAVVEAVVELLVRDPPRERDEDGAGPLCSPVQERRLEPVVEHDGDPLAGLDAEAAGEPPDAVEQLAVAEARERLELGVALAGRKQGGREVHALPPASCGDSTHASIASTIGV